METRITTGSSCSASMNRLIYSKAFIRFYVFLALLCIADLIWLLIILNVTLEYLIGDIILNLMIISELTIRIIAINISRFFKSWWNIADFFIVTASAGVTIAAIAEFSSYDNTKEMFLAAGGIVIITIRCIFQIIRILLILKMQWKRHKMLGDLDGKDSDESDHVFLTEFVDTGDDQFEWSIVRMWLRAVPAFAREYTVYCDREY
eukprot:gene7783-644_t